MAPGKSHTPVRTSWNFLKELNGTSPLENLEHTIFGSGIEIITSDMVADRSCESFCPIDGPAPVIFSFNLAGHASGEFSFSIGKKDSITCEPGDTIISFTPDSHWKSKIFACEHYRTLNIYIDPTTIY